MARYLSKPVHELVVDDMETGRNWTATGIATIGHTTGRAQDGKHSLRFRTSMRDEARIRANRKNGSFVGGPGGGAPAWLLKTRFGKGCLGPGDRLLLHRHQPPPGGARQPPEL